MNRSKRWGVFVLAALAIAASIVAAAGSKAACYASFHNVKVGVLQGKGLAAALKSKHGAVVAELNGRITDNNAKLFKQGYDSVLNPLYKSGALKKAKAGDKWTDWDP